MTKNIALIILCTVFNTQLIIQGQQTEIVGKVVNGENIPLANISLRIAFVGSQVSDDNGEFHFLLSSGYKPGSKVEFVINDLVHGHDTLVIFEPPRGVWNIPINPFQQPVKIVLLPKGDHRLLSKEGLKLLINDIVAQETRKKVQELENKKGHLEEQLLSINNSDPLKVEAERMGFTKVELLSELQKLKEQLEQSDDPYEVGLAALYDKHFNKAAELINQSILEDEQKVDKLKIILSDKYQHLGDSHLGNHNLKAAELAYRKEIEQLETDYKGYFNLAKVLYLQGDINGAKDNLLLSLKYYKETDDPVLLAHIKNNLGFLLLNTNDSVEKAVSYFQDAKKIYVSSNMLYEQLATDNNLTLAYINLKNYKEAIKIGEEGLRVFDQNLVFNISTQFEDELNEKKISGSLINEFAERKIQLSMESTIHINSIAKQWMIIDNENNKEYYLKNNNGDLLVFQNPDLYAQLNNNVGIAYNYLYQAEPNEAYLETAIKNYNQALEIRQKDLSPIYYANQNYNLALAHEYLHGANQKENLNKALNFFNEALTIYKQNNFTNKIDIVNGQIKRIKEKIQDLQ